MSELMFCSCPVSIISYSDDCISRKETIEEIDELIKCFIGIQGDMGSSINSVRELIKSLPSVEPKPKKARWIECGINYWVCSNDGCIGECFGHKDKYCNECGARMEEER